MHLQAAMDDTVEQLLRSAIVTDDKSAYDYDIVKDCGREQQAREMG